MKAALILIVFSFSARPTIAGPSNGPCTSDSQCAVFADECRQPRPILRAALPKDALSFSLENNTVIPMVNSDKKPCELIFIVHPIWPKNPVAKCVKNDCVIVEGN